MKLMLQSISDIVRGDLNRRLNMHIVNSIGKVRQFWSSFGITYWSIAILREGTDGRISSDLWSKTKKQLETDET